MAVKNSKGQAAVADAFFFLLIVMGCAAFLFAFAGGYGRTVSDYASKTYLSEYSTSALKTILYSSSPRDSSELLLSQNPNNQTKEVDYLIALIKQDFADDQSINTYKDLLSKNIIKILGPVNDSFDWVFFLNVETKGTGCDFPFVLVNVTDYTPVPVPGKSKEVTITNLKQEYYYCAGASQGGLCDNISMENIDNFLLEVGGSEEAFAPMNFPFIVFEDNSYRVKNLNGSAELILWRSTKIHKTDPADPWNYLDCDMNPVSFS